MPAARALRRGRGRHTRILHDHSGVVGSTVRLNPEAGLYDALVHPGQKLKPGARMKFEGDGGVLMGEILARSSSRPAPGPAVGRIGWDDRRGDRSARPRPAAALHQDGRTASPIASAIRPCSRASAAPSPRRRPACTSRRRCCGDSTARGVERAIVTLHVGYGTFKPVRVDDVEDHVVDPERYEIADASRRTAIAARARRRPPRHRGRDDDDPGARGCRRCGGGRRSSSPGTRRGRDALHPPRIHVPRRRRAADQLPPAAVVAADAGVRVRRRESCSPPIDAGGSRCATGSTATATRC